MYYKIMIMSVTSKEASSQNDMAMNNYVPSDVTLTKILVIRGLLDQEIHLSSNAESLFMRKIASS